MHFIKDYNKRPAQVTVGDRMGRILIVDDDLDFSDSIREVLEGWGYKAEIACDLNLPNPDIDLFDPMLILIDVRLGDKNGIDLLTKFIEYNPSLVCVMMTAYAEIDTAISALRHGAYDFLRKPFNPGELSSIVDRSFEMLQLRHDKKVAEAVSSATREELRGLAAHLQSVREEERISISRELHDEFGQVLTVTKMKLALIEREIRDLGHSMNNADILSEIDSVNGLIDKTVERMTNLITNLRPEVLDELGLIAALEWYTENYAANNKICCEFACNADLTRINQNVGVAIFRIVQEALTNVARHAQASSLGVRLNEINGNLVLEIEDDGIGIPHESLLQPNRFGLVGMRERSIALGGTLEIGNNGNSGTMVRVEVPLDRDTLKTN